LVYIFGADRFTEIENQISSAEIFNSNM